MSLRSERRFIKMDAVKSGMLVEFNYTKQDNTSKSYTIFVIDPDKDSYFHGYLLDGLSDLDIVRISTEFGREFNYVPDSVETRKAPIANLQTNEAYERYKVSSFRNDRRYRTFIPKNISLLRQILLGELE